MFEEMFKEDNIGFDLDRSTILVRLTPIGNKIIKMLDTSGKFPPNEEGYYEIFTTQLFTLYRSLLMSNPNGTITDLVDGPILIPSTYLKDKNGYSIKRR